MIILDGLILSVVASVFIFATLRLNPRIWLQDYPRDVQARVPPKTEKERRLSLVLGIPFLILLAAVSLISTLALKSQHQGEIPFSSLVLHAFGVVFVFNVIDDHTTNAPGMGRRAGADPGRPDVEEAAP